VGRNPPENATQRRNRERAFQERVLAALNKPTGSRFLRFINAPLFIWFLTLLFVAVGGGLYTNYRACVADSRELLNSHNAYRNEINFREKAIADAILTAKSIADVRAAIAMHYTENPDLKNLPMADLLGKYRHAYLQVDGHVLGMDGQPILEQSALYNKYRLLIWGYLDSKATDADLPDIKNVALLVEQAYAVAFLQRLTVVAEIHCSWANVFLISLGESPVTVREVATGSFAKAERASYPINVLPPKAN
jgi:hypothetical protein